LTASKKALHDQASHLLMGSFLLLFCENAKIVSWNAEKKKIWKNVLAHIRGAQEKVLAATVSDITWKITSCRPAAFQRKLKKLTTDP